MPYEILENFNFEGKDYEIRLSQIMEDFVIRVYHKDQPANGYSYHVSLEMQSDLKILSKIDAVKNLANTAKHDIENKKWEYLLEAIKESEK
ncbi:MAG: hypothetical protein GY714_21020 [Desulfobacterales bacterium]|nr:hypothetical protein [Desulfobacterales bacterium]